jgi:hypothetical protein
LLKQTAPGAPLCCSGNLAPIDHHVCAHRICETAVAAIDDRGPGVNDAGYRGQFYSFTFCNERIAQSCMDRGVNRPRRFTENRIARGNNNRIRQIVTVKDNTTARPSPDQIAFRSIISDIGKFSKISKRKGRGLPSVKTNLRGFGCVEQSFVDRHIPRRGAWREIVINVQRVKGPSCHVERSRDISYCGRRTLLSALGQFNPQKYPVSCASAAS